MRITGSLPQHVARAYGLTPPTPPIVAPAMRELVAARTTAPIAFDGSSAPVSAATAFPLYSRAADRIEAAVAVQFGRAIDMTG
jgi:hypothetical protein